MGDEELPKQVVNTPITGVVNTLIRYGKWIGLLLLFIPHLVGSNVIYYNELQPNQTLTCITEIPCTIDKLITHYALEYNVDEKLARDIIYCESSFNPDAINTKAVIGEDVGLFQLNSHYWQDTMALNGWNIYDMKDNIEAGMWLLSIEGSQPWSWSAHCWSIR